MPFFMQLNAEMLRKTFNTIPRIHHEKEEVDYIALTDSLIEQKFEVNLFDIETSMGMQQVSELSNKAIIKQLMLDENDYTWMISEQKEMIERQENKIIRLEEENRLIKIKIAKYVGDTNG